MAVPRVGELHVRSAQPSRAGPTYCSRLKLRMTSWSLRRSATEAAVRPETLWPVLDRLNGVPGNRNGTYQSTGPEPHRPGGL